MGSLVESKAAHTELDLIATAARINRHHREAFGLAHQALHHARQAGELLRAVKARLAHGEWLGWIAGNCDVSAREAQRYMRLAEHWDALKYDTVSHLGINAALKLMAAPRQTVTKSIKLAAVAVDNNATKIIEPSSIETVSSSPVSAPPQLTVVQTEPPVTAPVVAVPGVDPEGLGRTIACALRDVQAMKVSPRTVFRHAFKSAVEREWCAKWLAMAARDLAKE